MTFLITVTLTLCHHRIISEPAAMLSSSVLLVASMLAVTQAAHVIVAPVPVYSPEPGIRYNPSGYNNSPKVILEAFVNAICPDIIAAWPVIKEVMRCSVAQ